MQGSTEQTRQSGDGDQRQRRIADFGTHIPGARKELAARRIEAGLDIDPGFHQPLTETWPSPVWEKSAAEHAAQGRPAEDLALVRALRDQLRTSQGRRQEQRLAREGTDGLRKLAMDLIEGDLDARRRPAGAEDGSAVQRGGVRARNDAVRGESGTRTT